MKDAWLETITSSFLVYAVTDSYTFLFRSHPGHNLGVLSKLTELRADSLTPRAVYQNSLHQWKNYPRHPRGTSGVEKGAMGLKSTWSYAVRTVFY
jgi:hypothetical protein